MARTQEFRQLALGTPLGEDVLLIRRFSGVEPLGKCFDYELDLISENPAIPLPDVLGQNVTIRVQAAPDAEARYFNGFVSRFSVARPLGKTTEYEATVSPWLWFLTRMSDCRIFQEMTVPDIIKQVFRDHGFTDFSDRLTGEYRTWEYCVQYNETDFDFVSRLMEQEGIFYYFNHENGKHTLVLANASSTHDTVPGYEEIAYVPPTTSLREKEYISEWTMEQQVQPGVYSHSDFDFKKPMTSLLASAKVTREYATPGFEIYEYPGEHEEISDGEAYARRRIEAYQSDYEFVRGAGDVRGITTGKRFSLVDHPRDDQCKRYLVTGTYVEATNDPYASGVAAPGEAARAAGPGDGEAMYRVEFTAVDLYQPFRPRRTTPRPMIRGPQTAMVVGPSGEEIYTDEFGRVKVQFHWDRYSKADENSSCWIRVAQHWAGRKWGTMFIPRIGHEVIVEFIEGDPDRPIITGRVYNARTSVPYDLPDHMTMSTIKTLSSKGGAGFNEIRFEDLKGEEQIFVHAEKNQDIRVKNDTFEWIGNNRHLIVKKDQFEHVENERHELVDADHLEEIGKDRHLKIKGKEARDVDGSHSFRVGGDVIERFEMNHSEEVTLNYYLKGMGLVIEGLTGITIKVGGSSVVVDSSGVTLKGSSIVLDGSMVRIASGPGSPAQSGQAGTLVSPTAPTQAEEADNADPGEMTEVKARQREIKAGKYGTAQVKPFKPPEDEEEARKKTWIAIRLVDEADQPVAGARYRIKLVDGSVVNGTLDEKGEARVEGIDPGTCQITFPEYDEQVWHRT